MKTFLLINTNPDYYEKRFCESYYWNEASEEIDKKYILFKVFENGIELSRYMRIMNYCLSNKAREKTIILPRRLDTKNIPWALYFSKNKRKRNGNKYFYIEPHVVYGDNPNPMCIGWEIHQIFDSCLGAFNWLDWQIKQFLYIDDKDDIVFNGNGREIYFSEIIPLLKSNNIPAPKHIKAIRQFKEKTYCSGSLSKQKRIRVLEKDNYRCQICGRSAQDGVVLEVDHIIPRIMGGTNDINNLHVLCFDCNRGKSDKLLPNLIKRMDVKP